MRYRPNGIVIGRRQITAGVALALLVTIGCSPQPPHRDEARHYGPKINVQDFIKNSAKYKGKIITLNLKVDDVTEHNQGKALRDFSGRAVHFVGVEVQGKPLKMIIKIPDSVTVPDCASSEEISITFVCQSGLLIEGNEAKIIEKPTP